MQFYFSKIVMTFDYFIPFLNLCAIG